MLLFYPVLKTTSKEGTILEVISVKKLKKTYGQKVAVNELSFTVQKGEIFGLLGANGAGKSTTVECILGTKEYDGGEVTVFGKNPREDRKGLFNRIGVQFQESNYQDKIKVGEICEVTCSLYKNPLDYKTLFKSFGLTDKEQNLVSELSGGERQKLFVVLALIPDPELVFFDELTTGLDPHARREVWAHLKKLKENGLTVLMTSHFMDEVEKLCDRICILKSGCAVFTGSVSEAITSSPYETLEDAYLWYSGEEGINEGI